MRKVLVLGGYGNFGKRICESLVQVAGVCVVVAGRSREKGERFCQGLRERFSGCCVEAAVVDVFSEDFLGCLKVLAPEVVVHTCGPFQGQDFRVPEACVEVGAHYVDLADDRRFVCGIGALNDAALKQDVLVVSGASSVPGLSSVVVDHFLPEFGRLDVIDFAIAPGNQAERGLATVKAILSYIGHPFTSWIDGGWREVFGWCDVRRVDFGAPVGERWLANVDIPDLELFPARYSGVKSVRFQAGLELGVLHHAMALMAQLAKLGVVKEWSLYAKPIVGVSQLFLPFGSDVGGMVVSLEGVGHDGKPLRVVWRLVAERGVGPFIPTLSAVILVKKLVCRELSLRGALPCLGLFSLDEFSEIADTWGIYHCTERCVE